jgi:DNA-binding response OmpR family regulator
MVYRMRLEDAGFEVVEFGDGAEAWARLQAGGVALAVLDMKMPGMHGLDVLSNLAAKSPGLPVVICSAYDQLEDELTVQRYSPLKYLTKPVAPDTLVATVKGLLGAQAR